MKNIIIVVLSLFSIGVHAQSLCGCPTFLQELSNTAYLRFKSQCHMEIEEITVVISDNNYIMSEWLGEWYDGSFYNTALTQANEYIPYNLNHFSIFVDGTVCTYIDGIAQDELSIINSEQINDNYRVYPNPATNEIVIINNQDLEYEYFIYDIGGKLVQKSKAFFNQLIDVSQLQQGTYFIKIYFNNSSKNYKLIKQ